MDAEPSAFATLIERVAEELHSACTSDLRLFAVDLQVKFLLDEAGQSCAHSFRASLALAEYKAIVCISHKRMTSFLQLLVQLVEHYVAQKRAERSTLRCSLGSRMIHSVYHHPCVKVLVDNLTLDSATLTSLVEEKLHPRVESKVERDSLLRRFEKFKEAAFRDGIIGTDRHKHYGTVYGKLYRFLYINKKLSIRPVAMTADLLMAFRNFLYDEYQFVERYPKLYEDFDKRELPTKRRSRNTVVTEMKMVQAFFRELEDMEEIEKSPFRRLGKERKKIVMTSKYNDPVYLYKEEFLTILHADVPHYLEETRAAFVLQCAFGFRISDFKKLSLDIIKRSGFNFPVLRNQTGRTGYNAKIKSLLQSCHIDRRVNIFNEKTLENEYVPIYSIAGSKLCRSTFVDMMNKVQVNQYAAGLHKEGSDAINHYTKLELKDRFILMCQAFDEKPYSVKKDLSIFANKNA